jgi:hypothetical protein
MPSEWRSFDCPGARNRWRYLDDGRVEIEGEGTPAWPSWPDGVNQRRHLIQAASAKYDVPEEYVAAIMALETRGNNVCRTKAGGICYGPGPCDCISGEGCGLMAVMGTTASNILGRGVSCAQLMADEELAVEAGTAYLKYNLDKYGDFIHAAVAYNAGSVKCGRGRVFPGRYEYCPDPGGWGVVVGCVYSGQDFGERCAPAQLPQYGAYVCTSEYPRTAARMLNAAVEHYLGKRISPDEPGPVDELPLNTGEKIVLMAAGAIAGWSIVELVKVVREYRAARV